MHIRKTVGGFVVGLALLAAVVAPAAAAPAPWNACHPATRPVGTRVTENGHVVTNWVVVEYCRP